MTVGALLPIVNPVPYFSGHRRRRTMPSSKTAKPAASEPDRAWTWGSTPGDSDTSESGSSPWWRLALAAALAVVGMAATASLLA